MPKKSGESAGEGGARASRSSQNTRQKKAIAKKNSGSVPTGTPIREVPISKLHLDRDNPRFASGIGPNATEEQILDHIVRVHGIDDVLSSIGVNGFFPHEPLIGLQESPSAPITIVEGNRRLAACLILAGDPRAKKYHSRRASFVDQAGYGIDSVQVAILPKRDELLIAYLGIRHIAGAQPWDGYAKAAWVATVLRENPQISLDQITKMTGDQHRTIARLVEGYHFIQQLIRTDRFVPSQSERAGRRSSAEFPFSWVYTILGFTGVREWLDLESDSSQPTENPIPRGSLDRAEKLVDLMFGNKSRGIRSAIPDSRQLQDLAKVVNQPKILSQLVKGIPLATAVFQTRKTDEQLTVHLNASILALEDAQKVFGGTILDAEDARKLEPLAKEVRTRANNLYKEIVTAMTTDASDEV